MDYDSGRFLIVLVTWVKYQTHSLLSGYYTVVYVIVIFCTLLLEWTVAPPPKQLYCNPPPGMITVALFQLVTSLIMVRSAIQ